LPNDFLTSLHLTFLSIDYYEELGTTPTAKLTLKHKWYYCHNNRFPHKNDFPSAISALR